MRRIRELTNTSAITFAEVPLLIETATQGKFDEVWVVCAGKDLQLGRLKERLGSQEQAEEMLATQIPTEAKLAFADRVVRTNEPLEAVRIAIARHVKELVEG
jgi:dephospho-CoA kinase